MLGLLTRNLEPGTNMTQMHFCPTMPSCFPPKTAGHSIFGPQSDIPGGIVRTDPSQVNTISPTIVNQQNYFEMVFCYVHK